MEITKRLAWNLRRLRVAMNISQDDLALRANIERAYVGHIERGRKNPTIETLDKLSTALECDVVDLLAPLPADATVQLPLTPGRRKMGPHK